MATMQTAGKAVLSCLSHVATHISENATLNTGSSDYAVVRVQAPLIATRCHVPVFDGGVQFLAKIPFQLGVLDGAVPQRGSQQPGTYGPKQRWIKTVKINWT